MFYLSSTCSSHRHFPDMINELTGFGVHNIELSGNIKYYSDLDQDVAQLKAKHRLNYVVHNYFPPPQQDYVLNLASQNPTVKKNTLSLIRQAHTFIRQHDIPFYGIHGGHNVDMEPKMINYHFIVDHTSLLGRVEARKTLYDNIKEVMDNIFIDEKKFLIENLTPKSETENYALMATPDEIEEFFEFSRQYDNLGFLLDLGHLIVSAKMLGFDGISFAKRLVKNYADKIIQLHLSENDGTFDFHHVHAEDSWQLNILDEFLEKVPHIPVTFEWNSRANEPQAIARGIQMIHDRYNTPAFCNQ